MLDNMSVEEMKEAIRIIDGRAQTECSGNVTKENIDHLTSLVIACGAFKMYPRLVEIMS